MEDKLKTIGMLAGMSWESSVEYYRIINQKIKEIKGDDNSGKIIMYSFNFQKIVEKQLQGQWENLGKMLGEKAKILKNGGADFLIICANTMHKVVDHVTNASGLPVVHIVDALAENIITKKVKKAGLLGTKFVMDGDFYKKRLLKKYNIKTITPEGADKEKVHEIIYKDLCQGENNKKAKSGLLKVIDKLIDSGAEGIILGCTEIPLVIKQEDVDVPVFDTMRLHAEAAVEFALK